MSAPLYALLAEGLRYVFVLLFVVMFLRLARNTAIEFIRERKNVRPPESYRVFYSFENGDGQYEDWKPFLRDNLIGSSGDCDIIIKNRMVKDIMLRVKLGHSRIILERLCHDSIPIFVSGSPLVRKRELENSDIIEFCGVRMMINIKYHKSSRKNRNEQKKNRIE